MRNNTVLKNEIKKLHLEGVVLFAINNIPQADSTTLKQFLELVNADGAFGAITHEQIVRKMNQMLKYVPEACLHSLMILVDLLEIEATDQLLNSIAPQQLRSSDKNNKVIPFVIEGSKTVALGNNGFYSE